MKTLQWIILGAAVFFLFAANVRADLIYGLEARWHKENPQASDYAGGFEYVISKAADGGAKLTFQITDLGIQKGYGKGDDTVKFMLFDVGSFSTETGRYTSGQSVFKEIGPNAWDNGGWSPTSANLIFNEGYSWENVEEWVDTVAFVAHIQSIGTSKESINLGLFTYNPDDQSGNATPEPATLAILACGIGGLVAIKKRRFLGK